MRKSRPVLFRGRHFREDTILLCVRWYLWYPLSYRDLEEMMAERRPAVDHWTVARWVLHYSLFWRSGSDGRCVSKPVLARR